MRGSASSPSPLKKSLLSKRKTKRESDPNAFDMESMLELNEVLTELQMSIRQHAERERELEEENNRLKVALRERERERGREETTENSFSHNLSPSSSPSKQREDKKKKKIKSRRESGEKERERVRERENGRERQRSTSDPPLSQPDLNSIVSLVSYLEYSFDCLHKFMDKVEENGDTEPSFIVDSAGML